MKLQQIGIPVAAVAGLAYGYHALEWMGFFLVLGGLVMWALLHFTRLVKVLERAANRPIGHVDSAVMLNAKLKTGGQFDACDCPHPQPGRVDLAQRRTARNLPLARQQRIPGDLCVPRRPLAQLGLGAPRSDPRHRPQPASPQPGRADQRRTVKFVC